MVSLSHPDAPRVVGRELDFGLRSPDDQRISVYLRSSAKSFLELAVLVLLMPFGLVLIAIIAVPMWLFDGGPVFFSQDRVGKGGRVFRCLKFRTMCRNADIRLKEVLAADAQIRREWETCRKLRNDPRISRWGGFLRKSSLDELPQLFNILSGHMALVGPRPVVAEELELYGKYRKHYESVRPGLTGLWQVSGRSNTSYRKRVALDVTYARRASIRLDLWVLAKTAWIVVVSRGAV